MLTNEEQEKITKEFKQYERKPGACIDALKIVQESRGWVSDEGIRDIADFLGMSADEVDGVATFYNLIFRKPVGKNVLLICDSISCWVMGCEALAEKVKERFGIRYGQTTPDGEWTVLPNACLGACDRAPVIMVRDQTYTEVSPDKLLRLMEKTTSSRDEGIE
jgi:NADH-quinone oxidoreductase subunit E